MSARVPDDSAIRRRALDPRRSFIVQAPAGSGKTELLVSRYLKLLATVTAPEQILAITFTKKATAQMRKRILGALQGDAEIRAELAELARAARANDTKHGWNLARNPRRLRIKTIDAFCHELVRCMPWSARFGAPPELLTEPAELYAQAAAASLEYMQGADATARAAQRLVEMVAADWHRARKLLTAMLAKRDKWLRLIYAETQREYLQRAWREFGEESLTHARARWPAELQARVLPLARFAAANVAAAGAAASPLANLRELAEFPAAEYAALPRWRGLAELLLTKSFAVRKRVTKNEGFPAKCGEKESMVELLAELAAEKYGELVESLADIARLPAAEFSDAQWESLAALIKLLPVAAGELQVLFQRNNQADYMELTQRAERALGAADAPTDLTLALDHQLRHILMDEFQDTSVAHFSLLQKLTAGWQRDDGRTLFFVGDPMQSIYRFREAEVGNFLAVKAAGGLGEVQIDALQLASNFRARAELVDWCNTVFAAVLPAHDNALNSAAAYAAAKAYHTAPPPGAVHCHATPRGAAGVLQEAAAIAARIARARAEDAMQTIAVLGRARAHLAPIAAALRAAQVDFDALELEPLAARPAIRDVVSITQFLLQPAERIPALSLTRAPWCGLSLADLNVLFAGDRAATVTEVYADEKIRARLSADGRARLENLLRVVRDALARRGRVGLRENVEAVWLGLRAPATLQTPAELDDCQRYLELLNKLETGDAEITAATLAAAMENLWAHNESAARVQLLTIHKAKGLEFDMVILPSLARTTRGNEKPLLRWDDLSGKLLFAPLPRAGATDNDPAADAYYDYLARLEQRRDRNEAARLLYVACTRARRELHIFGGVTVQDDAVQPPSASSLLALLWSAPPVRAAFTAAAVELAAAATPADEEAAAAAPPHRSLPTDWTPPDLLTPIESPAAVAVRSATEPIEFSWAGDLARAVGVVLHEILQRAAAVDWDAWRRRPTDAKQRARMRAALAMQGVPPARLNAAVAQLADAVRRTRDDKKAAWIFSAAHREVQTEWQLAGVVDGEVRHIAIDRSFIAADGVRWIIDFKSSRHDGADVDAFLDREQERYRQQMATYAAVVKALPGEPPTEIRLGLYFAALQGWREWAGE